MLNFSIDVDSTKEITIYWKPITQTYALATHVGLSILLKLQMSSYGAYKIKVLVKPGYHKHQAAGKVIVIGFLI